MGRPYSLDLRERVVSAVRSGMSCREAAEHFDVGASTAIRWVQRDRGIEVSYFAVWHIVHRAGKSFRVHPRSYAALT